MNSTLRTVLILLVITVVIFVTTLILTNVPEQDRSIIDGRGESGIVGAPLQFASAQIAYDPVSESLPSRFFPGFFEVSDQVVPVSFWFQNPHPVPIKVKAVYRSCNQCTSARIGVLPQSEVDAFVSRAAVDALAAGPFSPPNLLAGLSAAVLLEGARWHNLDFDRPDSAVGEVPPAPAPGSSTWGIYQVGVKVGPGPKTLTSTLSLATDLTPEERIDFKVTVYGVTPFAVSPEAIELGELPEGSPDRTTMVYYWSATREDDELPPPVLSFKTTDPFLTVGKVERVPPADRTSLTRALLGEAKGVPIKAVYRFPVTVHRRRDQSAGNPSEPDIGPFTRTIGVTCPGTTHSVSLRITATITGLVKLADGERIDLGSFDGRFGVEKSFELISERPGLQLSVAEKEQTPGFVAVDLTGPRTVQGRQSWTLRVAIPGNLILGDLPRDSYVVLQAKSAEGVQRVRIPVVGRGIRR